MERWEFQFQDNSGTWHTITEGIGPHTHEVINIKLDNLQKSNPGKRVRAMCDGKLVDIR